MLSTYTIIRITYLCRFLLAGWLSRYSEWTRKWEPGARFLCLFKPVSGVHRIYHRQGHVGQKAQQIIIIIWCRRLKKDWRCTSTFLYFYSEYDASLTRHRVLYLYCSCHFGLSSTAASIKHVSGPCVPLPGWNYHCAFLVHFPRFV